MIADDFGTAANRRVDGGYTKTAGPPLLDYSRVTPKGRAIRCRRIHKRWSTTRY